MIFGADEAFVDEIAFRYEPLQVNVRGDWLSPV